MLKGLQDYSKSITLISKLRLWKYFIVPIIISIIVAITITITAYGLSDNVGEWMAGIWRWDWGKSTFTTFSTVIGGLVILVIGLILFKHIIMALSAPEYPHSWCKMVLAHIKTHRSV